MKGFCENEGCNEEIEINICCSGHMCGCMGRPTEPPFCSEQCYNEFMEKRKEKSKSNGLEGFSFETGV